jgi:hypothetical protein
LNNRLTFDASGCAISRINSTAQGMSIDGVLRHPGDGSDCVNDYFHSIILPEGVTLTFNGAQVSLRPRVHRIGKVRLQTVVYDPELERNRKFARETAVDLVAQVGNLPMIFELGIPIDEAPWSLPYDINVLQKTPLDTERDMLPESYKETLVRQLIGPMSDDYTAYMRQTKEAPPEIRDNADNAEQLTPEAGDELVKTVTGYEPDVIVLENRFDPDNVSEKHELDERFGLKAVNRGSLPEGAKKRLDGHQTVAAVHDQRIKSHVRSGPDFPTETPRQRKCLYIFSEVAAAVLGYPIQADRFSGAGPCAVHERGLILLNIERKYLWNNPMSAESLAVVLHECAHEKVSGHSIEFQIELERLAGRLAVWVGDNPDRWSELKSLADEQPGGREQ